MHRLHKQILFRENCHSAFGAWGHGLDAGSGTANGQPCLAQSLSSRGFVHASRVAAVPAAIFYGAIDHKGDPSAGRFGCFVCPKWQIFGQGSDINGRLSGIFLYKKRQNSSQLSMMRFEKSLRIVQRFGVVLLDKGQHSLLKVCFFGCRCCCVCCWCIDLLFILANNSKICCIAQYLCLLSLQLVAGRPLMSPTLLVHLLCWIGLFCYLESTICKYNTNDCIK